MSSPTMDLIPSCDLMGTLISACQKRWHSKAAFPNVRMYQNVSQDILFELSSQVTGNQHTFLANRENQARLIARLMTVLTAMLI